MVFASATDLRKMFLPLIRMIIFAGLFVTHFQATAQEKTVFNDAPEAAWITHPDVVGNAYGVFHFRRELVLSEKPTTFIVHVSGDNRYRFFVNGISLAAGPQRSDLMHWRYETLDIAPYLKNGENIIAATIWNWGDHKPVAQHTYKTGFLLQGDSAKEAVINTGADWKVFENKGYSALPVTREQVGGYYASPPGEMMDARDYPWGWKKSDYDDQSWTQAGLAKGGEVIEFRGIHVAGEAGGWQLTPRSIPLMEESSIRFDTVRRSTGIKANSAFLKKEGDLIIPAGSKVKLLLDQSHLTNAYTVLETSGGLGSKITLTYAEALKDAQGQKGNRNDIEGKVISGIQDVFYPDGGNARQFQTLWFRTYRYVEVDIETEEEALTISDIGGIYTAYPYQMNASFDSDMPWLKDMWDMNWRVTRLCAWETFFDTPYYEQLQYIGDTRIQALISLYMDGDDRLVKQAITHFDYSRIPEGITASRYPSDLGQYIPTFSLIWVAMIHDYWMLRDETEYVAALMPGIRSVLGWFEGYIDETGLLGPIPWWPFVDWATEWFEGTAPGGRDGHSVMISLQFAYALQRAAELEETFGQASEAARYRDLSDKLIEAARDKAWDADKGYFRDSLEATTYSQQTNTMAILVGAVPGDDAADLMNRILTDSALTQATYYYSYYVLEALREAGMANQYIENLAPWQEMLTLGLTTTPEQPDPSRTDSHAWAAHPNYGMLATVLGVRPAEPGFKSVRINPELGALNVAEGSIPHPLGNINVKLKRIGTDGLSARIILPEGMSGTIEWNGNSVSLNSGSQNLEL